MSIDKMIRAGEIPDNPVLEKMAPGEIAEKLREMGDPDTATAIEEALGRTEYILPTTMGPSGGAPMGTGEALGRTGYFLSPTLDDIWIRIRWPKERRLFLHTTVRFGYIPLSEPGVKPIPIRDAGNIEPDHTLKDSRIRITLDRLRVMDYPGSGIHNVLFDFYAQNQMQGMPAEDIHFNQVYRVRETEHAAIKGYPVFWGLNVGKNGVAFRCSTVNVKNDNDEAFLRVLESDVFKSGLQLATTLQPAIKPLSEIAQGMALALGNRNKNVKVQEFSLGLDFSHDVTGARLAEGSYVTIQIPEEEAEQWRWDDWHFDRQKGEVVHKTTGHLIPYNYVVFAVSRDMT